MGSTGPNITCDVALVDDQGIVVARRRIGDDTDGFRTLLELFTEHGDRPDNPIPVAIETSRGLLVSCLRATGRAIYAINPLAASRYRERHSVARAKSDHADAVMRANIVRTDAAAYRRLPADTELAQAIAVLARAGQDAAWNRQQIANQLRSVLREYLPAALEAFQKVKYGLTSNRGPHRSRRGPDTGASSHAHSRRASYGSFWSRPVGSAASTSGSIVSTTSFGRSSYANCQVWKLYSVNRHVVCSCSSMRPARRLTNSRPKPSASSTSIPTRRS